MSMFYLRAFALASYQSDRAFSVVIGTDAFPTRRIDAHTVAEIERHMNGYEEEARASGKPLQLYCVQADRARKPRGFDAATERGGPLVRFVNVDKVPQNAFEPRPAPLARTLSA